MPDTNPPNEPTGGGAGQGAAPSPPSAPSSPLGEPKNYLEAYRIYHSYIMDESNLITARITWILLINSFGFAAFAVILRTRSGLGFGHNVPISGVNAFDLRMTRSVDDITILLMSVVMIAVNYFGHETIYAAKNASKTIGAIFRNKGNPWKVSDGKAVLRDGNEIKTHKTQLFPESEMEFPHIRGGGNPNSAMDGHNASLWIPRTMGVFWGCIFLGFLLDVIVIWFVLKY